MTPSTAGYSGTPLPKKLGIEEGDTVVVIDGPDTLDIPVTTTRLPTRAGTADVIVFFTTERTRLERHLGKLRNAMTPSAGLWIAWPKKASKVATDMTEDVVREVALPTGLVDNKVCAIDETWSGLRLVIRKELRGDLR
jgi:hypothetical protein